jgi:Flp pilus assembly protein TadD
VLAGAVGIVTVFAQSAAGAVATVDTVPPAVRAGNAVISYAWYLVKMAWPTNLAALYPYPLTLPLWQVAGSALLLLAISWAAWRAGRRLPFVAVGWLWYLVMLLPVLGLLQAGPQARADRYTYLSMTGIVIIVVWGVAEIPRSRVARRVLPVAAAAALLAMGAIAHRQTQFWRTSEVVFRRAIDVAPDNPIALAGLATALTGTGRFEEAVPLFELAIRLRPGYAEAHGNLGQALVKLGRPAEGIPHFQEALRLKPDLVEFHLDLGTALSALGRDGAEAAFREAIRLAPDEAGGHSGLGVVLAGRGDLAGATREFSDAIRLDPGYVDAHHNLGLVMIQAGRMGAAIDEFREVVRLSPESVGPRVTLGQLLATEGRHEEAVAALTEAIRLRPGDAHAIDSLGGVMLLTGRLDEAIARFEQAARLRPDVPEFGAHLAQAEAERRRRGR